MRRPVVDVANQALLREGLSQGRISNYTRGTTRVGVECIESTFDESTPDEPDVPTAFVPCQACRELVPLHAAECPECGHPHPREIEQSA